MQTLPIDQTEVLEKIAALRAVGSAADLWDFKMAIHSLEKTMEKLRHNRVERVSKKYTSEVLRKMVTEEIRWRITRVREMRDEELQINDELRSKGTPYVERMKRVNARKIFWCDQEEERLTKLLSSFRVRPLIEWFDEVDYETARSMGMGWVIRTKLDAIIYG